MIQFNKIFIQIENQGIVHHYHVKYGWGTPCKWFIQQNQWNASKTDSQTTDPGCQNIFENISFKTVIVVVKIFCPIWVWSRTLCLFPFCPEKICRENIFPGRRGLSSDKQHPSHQTSAKSAFDNNLSSFCQVKLISTCVVIIGKSCLSCKC